jgi:hypothetical protein
MPRTVLALIAALSLLIACEPGYTGGTDQETWTAPDSLPYQTNDEGAFRTSCRRSHENFSDPIVFPGQALKAHLHSFFGAVGADWGTTNPRDLTHSTCEGGALNRTAYWVPAMIDNGDTLVRPADIEDSLITYYKVGHYDGTTGGDIVPFPPGFKMIQGNARATSPQPLSDVYWTCLADTRADSGGVKTPTIPDCPPGRLVQLSVLFRHCWDGVNLDSPDHNSHLSPTTGWVSNPEPDGGCPASHPVQLPALTEHVRWLVGPEGTDGWRLSSDPPDGPPGLTAHADWFNGWDPPIQQRWVDRCLNLNVDCRMGLVPWDDGSVRKLGTAVG